MCISTIAGNLSILCHGTPCFLRLYSSVKYGTWFWMKAPVSKVNQVLVTDKVFFFKYYIKKIVELQSYYLLPITQEVSLHVLEVGIGAFMDKTFKLTKYANFFH